MNGSSNIITYHQQNNKTLNKTPNINEVNNNPSSKLDILKMELLALSKHGIQYQDFINDLGLLIVYRSCGNELQRTELVKNKHGRTLLCEDFANHFLKLRTCSNFENTEWLENSYELMNDTYNESQIGLKADRYIFIHNLDRIGFYLYSITTDLEVNKHKSIRFTTPYHSMGIDIELQESGITILKFYDCTLRSNYLEISVINFESFKNIRVEHLIDSDRIGIFFPNNLAKNAIFLVYNNFKSVCNSFKSNFAVDKELEILDRGLKISPQLLFFSFLVNDYKKVNNIMYKLQSLNDGNISKFYNDIIFCSYIREPVWFTALFNNCIKSFKEFIKQISPSLKPFLINNFLGDLFCKLINMGDSETLELLIRQIGKLNLAQSELLNISLKLNVQLTNELINAYIYDQQYICNIFFERMREIQLKPEEVFDLSQIKAFSVISDKGVLSTLSKMRTQNVYKQKEPFDVLFIDEQVNIQEHNLARHNINTLFISKQKIYYLDTNERTLAYFEVSSNILNSKNNFMQYVFVSLFLSILLYYGYQML